MKEERMDIPTVEQFEQELKRLRYNERFTRTIFNTIGSLIVIVAISVLVSTMVFPVLKVSGSSMTPTLVNDEIVLCSKLSKVEQNDIVAFYYNNKVLLKRVIGVPGDVIDIKEDGTVFLNGEELEETYINEKALGECDISLPYQVPDNRLFVMGDHRAVSIDSRSTAIGCVSDENVIGKAFIRLSPMNKFGSLK